MHNVTSQQTRTILTQAFLAKPYTLQIKIKGECINMNEYPVN